MPDAQPGLKRLRAAPRAGRGAVRGEGWVRWLGVASCAIALLATAAPAFADPASDLNALRADVRNAEEAINKGNYQTAAASLNQDITRLSAIIAKGGFNDLGDAVTHYYRAEARFNMNRINKLTGKGYDLALAQAVLADYERAIATGKNDDGWGLSVAQTEYMAGLVAFNQLGSQPLAYSYWSRCADLGHAGCLNIMANAALIGEGGVPVDFKRALDYHQRVYETGTDYQCAGSYSARSMAKIIYFTAVKRPGDDALVWLKRARGLADRLESKAHDRTICGTAYERLEEFLVLLDRGERRDALLQDALDRSSDADLKVFVEYVRGAIDDAKFETAVEAERSASDKCSSYFRGLWYAEITHKTTAAQRYLRHIVEIGKTDCGTLLVYARKYQS